MISNKTKKLIVQFAEYMISGGVWFWSGYILIVLLDNHIGLFWANFIGNAVGITLNFLLQRYWVFRTKRPGKIAFTAGRYIVYTILNAFLLNYLILYALQEYAGLKPEIGQFIASAFFTFWNYFWYKVWVFPETNHPAVRRPTMRSMPRHLTSRHAAVSKSPVLLHRIENTPQSTLRLILESHSIGCFPEAQDKTLNVKGDL